MKHKQSHKEECDCQCEESCTCGCQEGQECQCEECHCGEESCGCGEECSCHSKEEEYLNMARIIQADFDNYRKKSYEQILQARQEGVIQGIEALFPALDSFKEAKKVITDEKVLEGVEMIEKKILDALKSLGVEKIETEGEHFDHNLHNAIMVINDNSLEDGVITQEFQAGYKFKDKVIRYSQVIVNKKEEK